VAATAVGVAVGALSAGLPTALQQLGVLRQAWPPDAVPGYVYETLADPDAPPAEPYIPRRASAGAMKLQLPRAAARTFGLFAEALADELLYRCRPVGHAILAAPAAVFSPQCCAG
jgi:hypothetical protein